MADRETHDKVSIKMNNDIFDLIKNAKKVNKTVAVIGTGLSGIQAIKACLCEGLDPICFERNEDLGGLWNYTPDTNRPTVYESIYIDVDRDILSFGDYPIPIDYPLLMHHSQVLRYLRETVIKLNLEKQIKFNTKVTFVTPHKRTKNGLWNWKIHTVSNGKRKEHIFDAVMICTGRHGRNGYIPKFDDLHLFENTKLHSSKYKSPKVNQFFYFIYKK